MCVYSVWRTLQFHAVITEFKDFQTQNRFKFFSLLPCKGRFFGIAKFELNWIFLFVPPPPPPQLASSSWPEKSTAQFSRAGHTRRNGATIGQKCVACRMHSKYCAELHFDSAGGQQNFRILCIFSLVAMLKNCRKPSPTILIELLLLWVSVCIL